MKQLLLLLLGIFVSIMPFRDLNAQNIQIDVKEKTLENGLKVLVWERPSAGRVGARMFYKVDIAAERPGTVGLTHMLEHHLFKGSDLVGTESWVEEEPIARRVEMLERMITDERNAWKECLIQRDVFAEVESECQSARLDSLETALIQATEKQNNLAITTWYDMAVQSAGGTNSTASTGRDWMKFDIDLPANKLELFMWTERSRVEHPVFRHFEPEKEVVVDQIRRYDNRPDGAFSRVMRSMTYDAHPYGWAHWFSDLTQATREDHWEIFYKYFIPQNTIISIVGDVDADEVFELAETYWGSWQKGRPSPRLRTVEPTPSGQKRLLVEAAAGPSVTIHVPMPAVGHPDAHVFDLMEELLGSTGGLLEQHLVDSLGIATRVQASAWTSKYPSHFEIRVDGNSNSDLDAIEVGINQTLQKLADRNVSDSEIQAAHSRLLLALAQRMDEIGSSAVTIGSMEAIYGWNHLNELQDLWQGTTADDLSRVSEKYFQSSMQTVGHLVREEPDPSAGIIQSDEINTREFGRYDDGISSNSSTRNWPVGGPISEFHFDRFEKKPAAAFVSEIGAETNSGQNTEPEINALAIAEQPWFTPPWMADHKKERFTLPMPANHWKDLEFDQADFEPPNAKESQLLMANGLRIFQQRSDLLPMIRVSAFVNSPEIGEPYGKEGISLLTSSLLQDGNRTVGDTDLNTALNNFGATLSVDTNRKGVEFTITAPANNSVDIIQVLGDVLSTTDLESNFQSVQNRVAFSADRRLEGATEKLRSQFYETLYGNDHRYGRAVTGESIRSISSADVQAFYTEYYQPRNITLAVSGPLDERLLAETIETSGFADIQSGGAQRGRYFQIPEMPAINGHQVVVEPIDTRQGHVMMGHAGIRGLPEDHAALEVMNYILSGGGFVSRMMELLRTQTGITSALYGEVEPGIHAEYPYMWRFSGNPETLARGIRLALQEIRDIKENGVTEEEFEAARTAYIDGLIPASYDTPHKTAERLAYSALHGMYAYQSPQYLNYYAGGEDALGAFRELTIEDVNSAAEKYLDPDNILILIGGPIDSILNGASDEVKSILGL